MLHNIAHAEAELNDAIKAYARDSYSSYEYRLALEALIVGAPCVIYTSGSSNQVAISAANHVNEGKDLVSFCRGFAKNRAAGKARENVNLILDHLVGVNASGVELLEIARRHFDLEEAA